MLNHTNLQVFSPKMGVITGNLLVITGNLRPLNEITCELLQR